MGLRNKKRTGLVWLLILAMLSPFLPLDGNVVRAESVEEVLSSGSGVQEETIDPEALQVEVNVGIPENYNSTAKLREAGIRKLEIIFRVSHYEQSSDGTAGAQAYFGYGENWEHGDIHAGSVLQTIPSKVKDSIDVVLPDGRSGRLASRSVKHLSDFRHHRLNTQQLVDMARALMGVSYMWGGTTTAGMDCSGLVKICYLNQGIILRRDAGEQATTGTPLGDNFREYRQGDLVFFKSATTGRIVHVGIYDGDGLYVHSSGRVRVNSLDPDSPLYIPSNILASGCRIAGNINTDGITLITNSPAYFDL